MNNISFITTKSILITIGLCLYLFLPGQNIYAQTNCAKNNSSKIGDVIVIGGKKQMVLKLVLDTLAKDTYESNGEVRPISLELRNSSLTELVRCRGIAFAYTPKVEEQLKTAGASGALLAEIKKAWSKVTNPSISFIAIGDDYRSSSDFDNAIASYNEAIQADPNSRAAYNQRGKLYQTIADKTSNQGDDSKRLAQKAKDQKNAEDLAKYTAEKDKYYDDANKNYDLAIEDFKQTTVIDPTNAVGFYNIATCYYLKQANNNREKAVAFYEEAIKNFTTAIEKSGGESETTFYNSYKYRGLAYGLMGKTDLKKIDIQKYCTIKPGDTEVCK